MTEELRKKLRYLQHLPITCQFEVAEIKLEEPAITKDTVEHFKGWVHTHTHIQLLNIFTIFFMQIKLK